METEQQKACVHRILREKEAQHKLLVTLAGFGEIPFARFRGFAEEGLLLRNGIVSRQHYVRPCKLETVLVI